MIDVDKFVEVIQLTGTCEGQTDEELHEVFKKIGTDGNHALTMACTMACTMGEIKA